MKFKKLCALFLLSIASIYFICPVLCAAIKETGEGTTSDKASSCQQQPTGSPTVDEIDRSTCCQDENEPTSPHENHGEEGGNCCFSRWESLESSEPQLASHLQKNTFLSVFLILATPRISSDSVSFTVYLQFSHKPYTDPSLLQLSPRAPPFFRV